ncbi:MAG: IPT/TIG domain-containing protein [Planctomycetes bacterium]|nr:IPT/TIG domain-containing protein [Planctomycetota bacterium]
MSFNRRLAYGFLFLIAAAALPNLGATSLIVGTGGSGSTNIPFNDPIASNGYRMQVCYSAATDLNTLGQGAIITELNIYYGLTSGSPILNGLIIRMAYTGQGTTLSAGTPFNSNLLPTRPDWVTVLDRPTYTAPTLGTVGVDLRARFLLDRAFAYNGGNAAAPVNLLIDISFTSRTGAGFQITAGAGRSTVYRAGAGEGPNSVTPSASNSAGNFLMEMVFEERPNLDVYTFVGTQQLVDANETGPGGNGLQVGKFSIENNFSNQPATNLLTVKLSDLSPGPADVTTAYTLSTTPAPNDFGVKLFRDQLTGPPNEGVYDVGDLEIGEQDFTLDGGDITFSIPVGPEQSFPAVTLKTYFVVVKLRGIVPGASTPVPLDTYQMKVTAITSNAVGFNPTGIGTAPGATFPYFAGIEIDPPQFIYSEVALGMRTAYLASSNNVLFAFEVAYPGGPQNSQTQITLTPSGTGLDDVDFNSLHLWWDKDLNNMVTAGDVDIYAYPGGHFFGDNSATNFPLGSSPGLEGDFVAPVTRRFLVVVGFGNLGTRGDTYFCQVTASLGHTGGAVIVGQPCPALPTSGFTLEGNDLVSTRNGPNSTVAVNSSSQGVGGFGELLYDFTLESLNGDWTATDLIFTAGGSGNASTAFSEVHLYEDLNGDDLYNGPAIDLEATVSPGAFTAPPTSVYTANLSDQSFIGGPTNARRFFLIVKFGGTALTGETFSCNLTDVSVSTQPGGANASMLDLDPGNNFGLVIDSPLITVTNAPTAPNSFIIENGSLAANTLAIFRFAADNANATITSVTLTTSGTGDFQLDLSSTNGLEAYVDEGNGQFDIADTLIGSSAGNSPTVTITFSPALFIINGEYEDIIIRINTLATCGASVPETFRVNVASPTDVAATGAPGVQLGAPLPSSNTMGVIIYFISGFIPLVGEQAGGEGVVINGSGFTAPASVSIAGVLCPGTALVNAQGTQITGITVPAGSGKDLTILLTTSALGTRTVPLKFSYAGSAKLAPGAGGTGCSMAPAAGSSALLATGSLAILAVVRRLRRRNEQ